MRMGERQSSSTSSTQLIKPNYHMVALVLFYQTVGIVLQESSVK